MRKRLVFALVFSSSLLLGVSAYFFSVLQQRLADVPAIAGCFEPGRFPGLALPLPGLRIDENGIFPDEVFGYPRGEKSEWFSKYLLAMHESSLLSGQTGEQESYRFLWLRTFQHPIVVRVERSSDKVELFFTELDGAGGYGPGRTIDSHTRALTEKQWCKLLYLINQSDFWSVPTIEQRRGNDGAEWVLEGVRNRNYRVVERWSPNEGDFREACIYLLRLADVPVESLGSHLY